MIRFLIACATAVLLVVMVVAVFYNAYLIYNKEVQGPEDKVEWIVTAHCMENAAGVWFGCYEVGRERPNKNGQ